MFSFKRPSKNDVLSWTVQLIAMGLIFIGVTLYQQRNMLKNDSVMPEAISVLDLNGNKKNISLTNKKEKHLTLIYFFAPWCSVCHLSIDNLEAIYQSYQSQLNVMAIGLDWSSHADINVFLARHKLTMPLYIGNQSVKSKFKISAYPSYYLLDHEGKIISKNVGYTTKIGMISRILLNQNSK